MESSFIIFPGPRSTILMTVWLFLNILVNQIYIFYSTSLQTQFTCRSRKWRLYSETKTDYKVLAYSWLANRMYLPLTGGCLVRTFALKVSQVFRRLILCQPNFNCYKVVRGPMNRRFLFWDLVSTKMTIWPPLAA